DIFYSRPIGGMYRSERHAREQRFWIGRQNGSNGNIFSRCPGGFRNNRAADVVDGNFEARIGGLLENSFDPVIAELSVRKSAVTKGGRRLSPPPRRDLLKDHTVSVRRGKVVKDTRIVLEIAVQVVPTARKIMVNKSARFGEIVNRTHCKHLVENVFGRSIVGDQIEFRLQIGWHEMDVEIHQARLRRLENIERRVVKAHATQQG